MTDERPPGQLDPYDSHGDDPVAQADAEGETEYMEEQDAARASGDPYYKRIPLASEVGPPDPLVDDTP